MKTDIIVLLGKLKDKSPFIDGKCFYCGGSEQSNHYPDCTVKDVDKIIEKYDIKALKLSGKKLPEKQIPKPKAKTDVKTN